MQKLGLIFGLKGLMYAESVKVLVMGFALSTVSLLLVSVLWMNLPEPWDIPPEWMGELGGAIVSGMFWLIKLLLGILGWLISFRFLMTLFMGMQLNRLIETMAMREETIETLLGEPSALSSFSQAFSFLLRTLRTHALWVPVYLVAALVGFLLPIVPVFIFWWVDGKLLAREYFLAVAPRFIAEAELENTWLATQDSLKAWGVLVSFLMTIPFLNMLAPLFATYSMVYVLGRRREIEG